MGYRRMAREAALGYLYQSDLGLKARTDDPSLFVKHFEIKEDSREFFLSLIHGVLKEQNCIDEELQRVSEHWKLQRMARVDRVILRMATWELMFSKDTPFKVILDEAVEIAKKFSTTESASFVNGLLDELAKTHRHESEWLEEST
jgi:N utilization substance protein B